LQQSVGRPGYLPKSEYDNLISLISEKGYDIETMSDSFFFFFDN